MANSGQLVTGSVPIQGITLLGDLRYQNVIKISHNN